MFEYTIPTRTKTIRFSEMCCHKDQMALVAAAGDAVRINKNIYVRFIYNSSFQYILQFRRYPTTRLFLNDSRAFSFARCTYYVYFNFVSSAP